MNPLRPKRIVILGMMSRMPVSGVVWQTLHYLVGFRRLGFDVYYVEAHARTPSMLMEPGDSDGSAEAAGFIASVMDRFDFSDRWAFHALHADGRCFGMSETRLRNLYAASDLIINLHGGTIPRDEHSRPGRLIYLETDPVEMQVQLHDKDPKAIDFLERHAAFFTFGELYGTPACLLPVCERFAFRPTRQPVVIDFWDSAAKEPGSEFTTIGNWRQSWRRVRLDGQVYGWSKDAEFMKFIDLPERTGQAFELALGSCTEDDRRLLGSRGWRVRDALGISRDLDTYRSYIWGSRGEFTVAKDQNVRLRTGWFSDRSATYLAAGRPVITQETGFSLRLPSGEGLFGFASMDDVKTAIDHIRSSYSRHARAAMAIARDCFAHDVVLKELLAATGV